jgi:hypothetical protein
VFNTALTNPQISSVVSHLQTKYSISHSTLLERPVVMNDKPVVLTTDTESEVEITHSGTKNLLRGTQKPKLQPQVVVKESEPEVKTLKQLNEEPKQVPLQKEVLKVVPQKEVMDEKDEFALEKLESEQMKNKKKFVEEEKPRIQIVDRDEGEKTPSRVDQLRQAIVDRPSAGVGVGNEEGKKNIEGSVCSTNVDPYKGHLPLLFHSLGFISFQMFLLKHLFHQEQLILLMS